MPLALYIERRLFACLTLDKLKSMKAALDKLPDQVDRLAGRRHR